MITTSSMTHAKPIADIFNWQGKELIALPGSPVDQLTKTIYGLTEKDTNIQRQSQQGISGRGHGDLESSFVKGTSRIISNVVSKARNEINPMRIDIKERVAKSLLRYTNDNAIATVVQVEVPALFSNDFFTSQLAVYSKSRVENNVALIRSISSVDSFSEFEMTDGEYEDLLTTGSSTIDGQVAKYVLVKGVYELSELLYAVDSATDDKLPCKEWWKIVAAYLMVSGIMNGNVERFDYLNTESNTRAVLAKLKASLGALLSRKIETITSNVRRGDLYVSRRIQPSSANNEIVVYGKAYRKWIEGEGSIEALLGAFILKGNGYSSATFNVDKEKAVAAYNRKLTYMENVLLVKRKDVFRSTVGSTITTIINEGEEEDRAVAHELLKKALDNVNYKNLPEDIYIRDVVCAVFTKGSEVQYVLAEIDSFMDANPESNLKAAVMFATSALVGKWIASQLECSK